MFELNATKKIINGAVGAAVLYMALTCPCETYLSCHKTAYLSLLGVMAAFALVH